MVYRPPVEPHLTVIPAVALVAVTAGYGREPDVLADYELRIEGAGLYRIAGPNGAGKSTLVELLGGYLRARSGEVLIHGHEASTEEARRERRICRTEPALYPMMTVRDHLVFASRWRGHDPEEVLLRARRYGLYEWLEHRAEALSAGNRRRLWLLQCTIGAAGLYILDEPFNGLDERSTAELIADLREWAGTSCVVLSAHLPPAGLSFDATFRVQGSAQPDIPPEAETRRVSS